MTTFGSLKIQTPIASQHWNKKQPEHAISNSGQYQFLTAQAKHHTKKMRILDKNEPFTFFNGSTSSIGPSNLDHIVAADHLQFKTINGADVDVRGWPQETADAKKDTWITKYSDHALLYFEVQKV